jgi:hypothetical protein
MRTLLFLLVGFLLLAACMLLGRLFSSNYPGATYAATLIFVVLTRATGAASIAYASALPCISAPRSRAG